MKLLNIFKKETKKEVKVNVQKMNKNQLCKVIGGGDVTWPGKHIDKPTITNY